MAKSPAKPRKPAEPEPMLLAMAASPAASGSPLDAVLGQSVAIAHLRSAVASGRVHHAWVFQGPPGVGKFLTAKAFAAELLDPRDNSPISVQARAGTHTDLHVITKELAAVSRDDDTRKRKQTNIPLEVLRQFAIEPATIAATLKSDSVASKVFIIDEAELIDPRGQNSLLKTLEEPPIGTVFILVTSEPDRLLTTVRSRSQPLTFKPLEPDVLAKWLDSHAPGLPKPQRDWVLWFADGSPGLAAVALKHDLHAWHTTLEPLLSQTDRGQFVPALGPSMAKLIDEQAAAAVKAAPDSSKEAANRLWGRRMLGYVARRSRQGLRSESTRAAALHALDATREAEAALFANVRLADITSNLAAQLALQPAQA